MHYAKRPARIHNLKDKSNFESMKKVGKILLVILIISIIIYFWNNEYMMLALTLLMYIGLIGNFVRIRRNVRIGKYMSVGKNYNNKFFAIFALVFGALAILTGIFSKGDSQSIFGINSKFIFGVFFILIGLFRTQRSLFLLTDSTIQFDDVIFNAEWEYKKLDKVVIRDNEIQFVKGIASEKFEIEEGKVASKAIRDFLRPKLENRLIIE